jgi:hypothetical protein
MNYKQIYRNIITKAKIENRKKNSGTYYEEHHIIPECLFKNRSRKGVCGLIEGNPEDSNNKILLTAREHFICHVLLYKIYKDTKYGYKIGSSLLFFFSKVIDPSHPRLTNFNHQSRKYEKYRLLGLESISKANKGFMTARDSNTGELVGRVSVNDSNVLSGKWVHHTKGRKISEKEKKNRKSQTGSNNTNFKELNEERKNRVFKVLESSLIENHLKISLFDDNLKKEFKEFKRISVKWITNNFGCYENLINEYNSKFNGNIQYNPYFRSTEQRTKATEFNNSKVNKND